VRVYVSRSSGGDSAKNAIVGGLTLDQSNESSTTLRCKWASRKAGLEDRAPLPFPDPTGSTPSYYRYYWPTRCIIITFSCTH